MSFLPATTSLEISIVDDAEEAVAKGHDYKAPEFTGLRIDGAVIVRKGTNEGNSTVDFVLVDATGKKYVTMITGKLLKALPL